MVMVKDTNRVRVKAYVRDRLRVKVYFFLGIGF